MLDEPQRKKTRFGPGGGFAYRPGELIVPKGQEMRAEKAIKAMGKWQDRKSGKGDIGRGKSLRFTNVADTLGTRRDLVRAGIPARLNHVLFATGGCGCCGAGGCPPHPSSEGAADFYKAHPFYSNPFYSNPFYSNVEQNPGAQGAAWACERKSSAKPAPAPALLGEGGVNMRIGIIDTGYAKDPFAPPKATVKLTVQGTKNDVPDVDLPGEPGHGALDPVAGHGTFVAGVVEQQASGSTYYMHDVVSPCGDADEQQIAQALEDLADLGGLRPQFVNISLAGYSPYGMETLTDAILEARAKDMVIVASAGNDATCLPAYPAALPGVVGVGALDANGAPATFTNYGPWVNASTLGVDVTSIFFDGYAGAEGSFTGGATWSGTSFAAPRVVGVLAAKAREISNDPAFKGNLFDAAAQAVEQVIDNAAKTIPMLGAIVP